MVHIHQNSVKQQDELQWAVHSARKIGKELATWFIWRVQVHQEYVKTTMKTAEKKFISIIHSDVDSYLPTW